METDKITIKLAENGFIIEIFDEIEGKIYIKKIVKEDKELENYIMKSNNFDYDKIVKMKSLVEIFNEIISLFELDAGKYDPAKIMVELVPQELYNQINEEIENIKKE